MKNSEGINLNIIRCVDIFPPFERMTFGMMPTYYYISREQAKLGVNIYMICKKRNGEESFVKQGRIHVYRVKKPYFISTFYKLIFLNKNLNIEIVHAHASACYLFALLKSFFHKRFSKSSIRH